MERNLITLPFDKLQLHSFSTSVSCSLPSRCLFFRLCIRNTHTFDLSFSALLRSQSRFVFNPNDFHFSAELPSPLHRTSVSRSLSSRCLSFRRFITNSRTSRHPLSVLLLSQSLIDINLNLSSSDSQIQSCRPPSPARLFVVVLSFRLRITTR